MKLRLPARFLDLFVDTDALEDRKGGEGMEQCGVYHGEEKGKGSEECRGGMGIGRGICGSDESGWEWMGRGGRWSWKKMTFAVHAMRAQHRVLKEMSSAAR